MNVMQEAGLDNLSSLADELLIIEKAHISTGSIGLEQARNAVTLNLVAYTNSRVDFFLSEAPINCSHLP